MIAADTSTWIAFLEGASGADVRLLDKALEERQMFMIPVVLTELLSDPGIASEVADTLAEVPLIDLEPGYWQRAGVLRAKVLSKQRKARLGDALIAQTCVDRGIPLLTRDKDFPRELSRAAPTRNIPSFRFRQYDRDKVVRPPGRQTCLSCIG